MKKIIALVLSLMLVCACFTAFAAGSKTTDDVNQAVVNNNAAEEEEEEVELKVVDFNEATQALLDAFEAAEKASDVIDDDSLTDEELVELIPVEIEGVVEGETGEKVISIKPTVDVTGYENIRVFFGMLNDGDEDWAWEEADKVVVNDDGTLDVTVSEDLLLKLQDSDNVVIAVLAD